MHHDNATLPPHDLQLCRGIQSCPHAVPVPNPQPGLETLVRHSDWPGLLTTTVHPIRQHHRFRIAVAMCPSGCSRPHIADFGLIAAAQIALDPDHCTSCGRCVQACAENALQITADGLRLDARRCLGCRACVRVCPHTALSSINHGFRVVLGGKLGRHPRLAHELGFFSTSQAFDVLGRTLDLLTAHYRPGLRLGQLVLELGQSDFDRQVRP